MKEQLNKQTNLSTGSRVCPQSPGECEYEVGYAKNLEDVTKKSRGQCQEGQPGGGGHGEESEQEEGGVEQGEQVGVGARPGITVTSKIGHLE